MPVVTPSEFGVPAGICCKNANIALKTGAQTYFHRQGPSGCNLGLSSSFQGNRYSYLLLASAENVICDNCDSTTSDSWRAYGSDSVGVGQLPDVDESRDLDGLKRKVFQETGVW